VKDYDIIQGDCRAVLHELPEKSVQCVVTSPPYWGLRDYKLEGAGIGLEKTLEEYIDNMVAVFQGVRRVLRDDGCVWLNMGDAYTSSTKGSGGKSDKQDSNAGCRYEFKCTPSTKPKDLIGLPWRVAFALQADGWWLRSDCIWAKRNPMPESVTDRPTRAHEYVFLLSKRARYFYDAEAVRERTGNEASAEEYAATDGRVHFHDDDLIKGMSQLNGPYPPRRTKPHTSQPIHASWWSPASRRGRRTKAAARSAGRRGCGWWRRIARRRGQGGIVRPVRGCHRKPVNVSRKASIARRALCMLATET
jgi:DNA modification methylase